MDVTKILTVEIRKDTTADTSGIRVESVEYLLDMRSKLLMTEVPAELEVEMDASAMVDAFVTQLQVLSEISDIIVSLNIAGHSKYQEDFSLSLRFVLDGLPLVNQMHAQFVEEASQWAKAVKANRASFYYLNFFTMVSAENHNRTFFSLMLNRERC